MSSKNIFILIIGLLFLGTIATVVVRSGRQPVVAATKYDEFAQCLADKKLTMYGTIWCSHCQAQKALFGASFQYVPYVECPDNPNSCLEKDINNYPTWIALSGEKYIGEQSLEKLSQISSCVLPAD